VIKPLKILHVVSSLNVGGAERFVIDLASEQLNGEHLIGVLSMGAANDPLEGEVIKLGLALYNTIEITEIRAVLKNYDVVHIHSSHCLLRVLLSSFFLNTKIIYTRHNVKVHQSTRWRIIYFLAWLKLHKIAFVAETSKKLFLNTYPLFKKRAFTCLNGVIPMSTYKSTNDHIRLSIVGRFVSLKSHHHLIEAVASLPDQIRNKISLSFFGTGELMDFNKQQAEKLLPHTSVKFCGYIADRAEIYENTDILVVTSETEGLSLAIIEALASGTPVIASDVGGNPELISSGINGFLYPYADIKALSSAIELLTVDSELQENFSQHSLTLYKMKYSMSRCAAEYITSYT